MTFQFCSKIRPHGRLWGMGASNVKDLYQILREKELDMERIRKEIEALRFVAPLLAEDAEADRPPKPSPVSVPVTSRWAGSGD